ncbi:hypothetical protein, partial [Deinococcus xinjiangensis]|uniref:hypothetical protein n=1 Tax=Deinococcus xinjiangensis TaxID=457454 RepID=UPI0033655320
NDFSLEASHLGSKSFTIGTGLLRNSLTLPVSRSPVPLLSSYFCKIKKQDDHERQQLAVYLAALVPLPDLTRPEKCGWRKP